MASEVEICNVALAHLGDTATVASLDPPEGSAQAEHCARFYPIARDSLLEMHAWNFATARVRLAEIVSEWPQWRYAYAVPADFMRALAVLPADSIDDLNMPAIVTPALTTLPSAGRVPRPYVIETDSTSNLVILTNEPDALLRYVREVSDTTRFSPLFTMTLTHLLASMLAGPIIKGAEGNAESKRQLQLMNAYLTQAKGSDAQQRDATPTHHVGWMTGR